jgi:hypothetical protein
MTKRFKRPAGLVGASGLAAAIIAQATVDAVNADPETMRDAWAYLGGDWYRMKADMLGIPSDAWPTALEHTSVSEFIDLTDRLRGKHDGINPSD